ncbi:MAG: transposase [Anaerolineales bacterium]
MTTFFRRNLPHYHQPNATYFITFRLAGSLPLEALQRLEEQIQDELRRLEASLSGAALFAARYEAQKRHFARFDSMLDQARHGPRWLAQSACAQTVMQCIRELEPVHYHLHAFCLMPNHIHLLIDQQDIPDPAPRRDEKRYTPLSRALRLLKGKSAALCNRLLGRGGAFWQHESYDHLVRNEREYERILAYILENPVKAGLAARWDQWPYTYLAP